MVWNNGKRKRIVKNKELLSCFLLELIRCKRTLFLKRELQAEKRKVLIVFFFVCLNENSRIEEINKNIHFFIRCNGSFESTYLVLIYASYLKLNVIFHLIRAHLSSMHVIIAQARHSRLQIS